MEIITLAAVIGPILTFFTVVLGFYVQYKRENRQHQWDISQRADTAQELARRTDAGRMQSVESEARLTAQIADNTEVSKSAFKEANDINNKLHALGLSKELADSITNFPKS